MNRRIRDRLAQSSISDTTVRLQERSDLGLDIWVNETVYHTPAEIEDQAIRSVVQQALDDWQQDPTAGLSITEPSAGPPTFDMITWGLFGVTALTLFLSPIYFGWLGLILTAGILIWSVTLWQRKGSRLRRALVRGQLRLSMILGLSLWLGLGLWWLFREPGIIFVIPLLTIYAVLVGFERIKT